MPDEIIYVPRAQMEALLAEHIKQTRISVGCAASHLLCWAGAYGWLGHWYSGIGFAPFAVLYGIRAWSSYRRARLCRAYMRQA